MNAKKRTIERFIILFSFMVYVASYLFVLTFYGMGTSLANFRYYFLLVLILIYFAYFMFNKKSIKQMKNKELLLIIPLSLLFLILSYFKAKSVNYPLQFRTFVQISLILFPGLFIFLFNNILNKKEITSLMKLTLLFTVVAYFLERRIDIFNYITYSNIFLGESSTTESSLCSEIFMELYFFFNYYDLFDSKGGYKKYKILSFVFTLLSFKRLAMVFAVLTEILNKFVMHNYNKKVSKVGIIIPIFFTIITVLYTKFVNYDLKVFNINPYKFTTGRSYILSLWRNQNFLSYGYGTSMLVIKRYLEMDLVQIYLEIGLFALLVFCLVLYFICQKKKYSLYILCYMFLNLLFASTLPSTLPFIIFLINISYLQDDGNSKIQTLKEE